VRLSQAHRDRLDHASAVDLGFPHEFLRRPMLRQALFGDTTVAEPV
jgi:hypothetical protein